MATLYLLIYHRYLQALNNDIKHWSIEGKKKKMRKLIFDRQTGIVKIQD